MAAVLGRNHHGKGRVRLTKVMRKGQTHELKQFTIEIILEGPLDTVFTQGDNSLVVATDTQKNTTYILAQRHDFKSGEEFAFIMARHFVSTYPDKVTSAKISVVEHNWERVAGPDSRGQVRPHAHGFQLSGPGVKTCSVKVERDSRGDLAVTEGWSGCRDLTVLKTTQSSFTNFVRDQYTALPEADDRLMGTAIEGRWDWSPALLRSVSAAAGKSRSGAPIDFDELNAGIAAELVNAFLGPADTGVPSASVQETCFQMGSAVLGKFSAVEKITLNMPNIHNIPFDFSKFGTTNADHTGNPNIFFPIDEPHGIIEAVVERPRSKL